jgi:hypothetical protein
MMISDGETKGPETQREGSHTFPLLNRNAFIGQTDASSTSGDRFKPLFDTPHVQGNPTPHNGLCANCAGEDRDSEDIARRKGFELGFDAGKLDACSLVQEELAPQIRSFADAFNTWNAIMMRVEEKSNHQILKMAVAIAEKILGAPPQCCPGSFESLETDLKVRVRKAYQLEFKLNPTDMDALSRLLACENVHWEQWEYIKATGDAEIKRGVLQVQPGPRTLSADDSIQQSLINALSEVSTK